MLSRFLLGSLALASLFSTVSTVSANVVQSGDFENVAAVSSNWFLKYAVVEIDETKAHSGSNYIRSVISSDAPDETLARIAQYLVVPEVCPDGSSPKLSFFYRTDGSGVSSAVHVYQGFEDTHPRVNTEVHQILAASDSYTQASADLSVFAGYQVSINIEFLGADDKATFYADDFSIC